MFRKSTMIALTAVAALGLAISTASAMPKGPGIGKGPVMQGPGINPGIAKKPNNPGINKPNIPVKPIFVPHWHHKHPHWQVHYRPRVWYAAPVVATTYAVSRPGPCTCLSKEYTPEGAVLFKDRCTNEMAMNPPAQPAPQQTGALEQPYQQQYVQAQPTK